MTSTNYTHRGFTGLPSNDQKYITFYTVCLTYGKDSDLITSSRWDPLNPTIYNKSSANNSLRYISTSLGTVSL